jgi:hypothetical protein
MRHRLRDAVDQSHGPGGGRPASGRGNPTGLLALQAAAGNRAVASLVAQRQAEQSPSPAAEGELSFAELGLNPVDVMDSALPASTGEVAGAGESESGGSVQRRSTGPAPVQRLAAGGVVQRAPAPCPPYVGYSSTVPLAAYNCAGLAHRTYDFKSLPDAKKLLAGGTGGPAAPGQVKHWLWEYDLLFEDSAGRRTPAQRDFHTVAGVVDPKGADPADVYSKNGKRPVYGPGTGPGFKPPPRERATASAPTEDPIDDAFGKPLLKLRQNMTETTHLLACPSQTPPTQGPPAP